MPHMLTIGTRGSKLALWQAHYVRDLLLAAIPALSVHIEVIHTKGDKILDVALSKIGDKGLFTKELEQQLIEKNIDICVHSAKDLPTMLPQGLEIAAVPTRADARDALVHFGGLTFDELPGGVRVATGSLRRSAQLAALRRDIELCEIRGNVDTRVEKVREGQFDAVVLASAGLTRMGMQGLITEYFEPTRIVPAVGQGAIGIEARSDDARVKECLAAINDKASFCAVHAERHILRALEGGCQVPIGAYAQTNTAASTMHIQALVASLDGANIVYAHKDGTINQAESLAQEVVEQLCVQGARDILEAIK